VFPEQLASRSEEQPRACVTLAHGGQR
jgi:hypothetical protein